MVNDTRQGFVPFSDQRQHVLAAQYAQIHPPFTPQNYQYGVQSLPAPSDLPCAQATVLADGRAPLYADPPSHCLNSGGGGGGGGVSHSGGNGGGISQFGGGGGYQVHGGGGGYQGSPSFFPAYAQQTQPVMLRARSVKMLGSNAAADSRAGDPGDRR